MVKNFKILKFVFSYYQQMFSPFHLVLFDETISSPWTETAKLDINT